jgi:hypothetical protein
MVEVEKPGFDVAAFLSSADLGRSTIHLAPKDAFFSGEPADSVFIFRWVQAFAGPGPAHGPIRLTTNTSGNVVV